MKSSEFILLDYIRVFFEGVVSLWVILWVICAEENVTKTNNYLKTQITVCWTRYFSLRIQDRFIFTNVMRYIFSLIKEINCLVLLLKPGPGPWALTLKNRDPEKPGINIGWKNMSDFKKLCFTKTNRNVIYCLKVCVLTDI